MSKQRDPKTGKFVRTTPDYKALYEAECSAHDREKEAFLEMRKERNKLQRKAADYGMRLKFLLHHCGPICKWLYKRKFCK